MTGGASTMPLTDAAVVLLGGPSNTRCPGGTPGSGEAVEAERVRQALATARRGGARMAVLVGGEPTTRRDLPALLRATRAARLVPGLVTNGRMLLYERMRDLLLAAGVGYLRVELYGARAATHDRVVGVEGAFEQTWRGLSQMLARGAPGLRLEVAGHVSAASLEELDELVDRVTGLARTTGVSLRLVAPMGGIGAAQWPPAAASSERVGAALERAVGAGADVTAAWEGFAPCLLESVAPLRDEILRFGAPVFGPREVGAAIPLERPGDRSHPYPCQECVHEPTCPGAPAALLAHDGEVVLRPTRSVRANSFNYEVAQRLDRCAVRAGDCEVPALPLEGPPARSLVLVEGEGGGATLYRSPTADFTDEEVRHVKEDIEQIYFDRMEGAALDDFANTMKRVRLHDECGRCPRWPGCMGAFVVQAEPPFRREERWLRKEVSRMRGRVLDVGCGEQPYREEVSRLIAEGHIDYHGLDPDEEALESIRESGMGGTLHPIGVEEMQWEPGYFDYVLGLRSLNHFRDMEKAFDNIARMMRVDGQLVLCDAPPFAMLRTGEQVQWADEHAKHGHEHFRNWSSEQVVEFLKRFPFRVDTHRPVSAKTSNQWILKMVRVASAADARQAS